MPTIPLRQVNSIENDIPVCHPDRDLCQLRINDEGGVACFESQFAHTTSAFAATHNLALENYNDSLVWLSARYHDVCRSEYVDTSDQDGRFELFSYRIMNRSDVQEEAQGILDAVAGDAAAGIDFQHLLDPNHFPTCIAEAGDNNGSKVESIWLTAAEAEYLSSKFASHGRMVGCHIGRSDDSDLVQFWLTSNPETLGGLNEDRLHFSNGVIDRINEDIRGGSVPEGVRAREIVDSLVRIRESNMFVSGVRSQKSNDAAVESNKMLGWLGIISSVIIGLAAVGAILYQPISAWRNKRKKTSMPTEDYTDAMRRRMDAEQYRIRGWDSEAEWALRTLKSARFPNLIIDAPTQWGKDIIFDRMIQLKVERNPLFPPYFLDAPVRQMVLTDFVSDTGVQGNIGDKVKVMIDAARKGPVIFLISEIDKLLLFGVSQHASGGRVTLSPEAPAFQLMNAYNNPVIRKNLAIWGSSSRYPELVQMINDLIGRFNQLKLTEQKHILEIVEIFDTGFPRTDIERNNQVTISRDIIRDMAILAERYYRPFRTTPDELTGRPIVCARFPAMDDIMRDAARIAQERLIAEKVAQGNGHTNGTANGTANGGTAGSQVVTLPEESWLQRVRSKFSVTYPRLSRILHLGPTAPAATTTGAQQAPETVEPLGAVTTGDVVKAVEGRIRRSLNRAEVNAVLALSDSELPFIEIPDEPPSNEVKAHRENVEAEIRRVTEVIVQYSNLEAGVFPQPLADGTNELGDYVKEFAKRRGLDPTARDTVLAAAKYLGDAGNNLPQEYVETHRRGGSGSGNPDDPTGMAGTGDGGGTGGTGATGSTGAAYSIGYDPAFMDPINAPASLVSDFAINPSVSQYLISVMPQSGIVTGDDDTMRVPLAAPLMGGYNMSGAAVTPPIADPIAYGRAYSFDLAFADGPVRTMSDPISSIMFRANDLTDRVVSFVRGGNVRAGGERPATPTAWDHAGGFGVGLGWAAAGSAFLEFTPWGQAINNMPGINMIAGTSVFATSAFAQEWYTLHGTQQARSLSQIISDPATPGKLLRTMGNFRVLGAILNPLWNRIGATRENLGRFGEFAFHFTVPLAAYMGIEAAGSWAVRKLTEKGVTWAAKALSWAGTKAIPVVGEMLLLMDLVEGMSTLKTWLGNKLAGGDTPENILNMALIHEYWSEFGPPPPAVCTRYSPIRGQCTTGFGSNEPVTLNIPTDYSGSNAIVSHLESLDPELFPVEADNLRRAKINIDNRIRSSLANMRLGMEFQLVAGELDDLVGRYNGTTAIPYPTGDDLGTALRARILSRLEHAFDAPPATQEQQSAATRITEGLMEGKSLASIRRQFTTREEFDAAYNVFLRQSLQMMSEQETPFDVRPAFDDGIQAAIQSGNASEVANVIFGDWGQESAVDRIREELNEGRSIAEIRNEFATPQEFGVAYAQLLLNRRPENSFRDMTDELVENAVDFQEEKRVAHLITNTVGNAGWVVDSAVFTASDYAHNLVLPTGTPGVYQVNRNSDPWRRIEDRIAEAEAEARRNPPPSYRMTPYWGFDPAESRQAQVQSYMDRDNHGHDLERLRELITVARMLPIQQPADGTLILPERVVINRGGTIVRTSIQPNYYVSAAQGEQEISLLTGVDMQNGLVRIAHTADGRVFYIINTDHSQHDLASQTWASVFDGRNEARG